MSEHEPFSPLLTGQVFSFAPFVPGAVVVRQIRVAQHRKREENRRRRHAAIAVGDDALFRVEFLFGGDVLQDRNRLKRPLLREKRLTRPSFVSTAFQPRKLSGRYPENLESEVPPILARNIRDFRSNFRKGNYLQIVHVSNLIVGINSHPIKEVCNSHAFRFANIFVV